MPIEDVIEQVRPAVEQYLKRTGLESTMTVEDYVKRAAESKTPERPPAAGMPSATAQRVWDALDAAGL